jgi:hypothetical protein
VSYIFHGTGLDVLPPVHPQTNSIYIYIYIYIEDEGT